jgi:hypothetical protein
MQNPFAIAVQWPDSPRHFIVHLERPYFTAAVVETTAAAWLALSWAPGAGVLSGQQETLLEMAANFCRTQLVQGQMPIQIIERKGGFQFPTYLIAQSGAGLFIVEPDHATPLVEVRESLPSQSATPRDAGNRFDVITQWRLTQMRKYYQQFLERQQKLGVARPSISAPLAGKK